MVFALLVALATGPAAAAPASLPAEAAAQVAGPLSDGATAPPALAQAVRDYRALKPMTASMALVGLLADPGLDPATADAARFLLARCLYDLQMYVAAEALFLRAVDRGPEVPWLEAALPFLARTGHFTGDWSPLQARIRAVPADRLPRDARLAWLRGRALLADGDADGAAAAVAESPAPSTFARPARYLAGVASARQGRHAEAIRAFADVLRAVDAEAGERMARSRAAELDEARDRAIVGIASVFYAAGRYEEARAWAERVRSGPAWPDAQRIAAWVDFLLAPNVVTGPGEREHANDGHVELERRAAALAKRGAPPLVRWELTWLSTLPGLVPCGPSVPALTRAEALRDELARVKASLAAARAAAEADAPEAVAARGLGALPAEAAAELAGDPILAALRKKRAIVAWERAHIDAQKPSWREPVGTFAHGLLDAEEARISRVEGERIVTRLRAMETAVGELHLQAAIGVDEVVGTLCNF